MTDIPAQIARIRTASQQITLRSVATPLELVSWFGAMQAQEYWAAKWAIAARLQDVTDADIEQLVVQKALVRTWPMRGTIHFVLPEDAHWMLELMAVRKTSTFKGMYDKLGIDDAHFAKAAQVLADVMQDGTRLTRQQIRDVLERAGLDTSGQRAYHTVVRLAHQGLLVIAQLEGKQPTFAWSDAWIPPASRRHLDREEALAEMALKYIRSHGPVTTRDFSWWTGLTMADSRHAFELIADHIKPFAESKDYWLLKDAPTAADVPDSIFVSPAFDETVVALKDRSAVVLEGTTEVLTPYIAGVFSPLVLVNGQFVGVWKRTIKPKGVEVACELIRTLPTTQTAALRAEFERYATSINLPLLSIDISRT